MSNLENTTITNMTVYVDDSSRNVPLNVYAKQYDTNTRFLKIRLMQASGEIPVTGLPQLNCIKPNGQLVYTAGTVEEDGTVMFKLTSNMLSNIGKVSCDVSIFDTENSEELILTSSTFFIVVDKSNYDSEAIEGFDEFSTVSDVLAQAEEIKADIDELKSDVEGLKSDIENDILQKADGLEVEGNQFYLLSGSTRLNNGVSLTPDATLTESGEPADAKATGDAIGELKNTTYKITETINDLIDGATWTEGYAIAADGTISELANYHFSNIIDVADVSEISMYIVQYSANSSTTRILGYDKNGQFLSQLSVFNHQGAGEEVIEFNCDDIAGLRISKYQTNMIRALTYGGAELVGFTREGTIPIRRVETLNTRLLASSMVVSPSIFENAFNNASYNYIFNTANKVQNGSFIDGTFLPATVNSGVPEISDTVYSSRGYSLKCFGNVSTQIKTSASFSANHYYFVACRIRVDRYVSGDCGVMISDNLARINRVTNGFEFAYTYFRPSSSGSRNIIIGTINTADADCYIDDVLVVDTASIFGDLDLSTDVGKNTATLRFLELQNNYIDIINGDKISKRKYYSYCKPKFVTAILNATSDDARFFSTRLLLRIAENKLNGIDTSAFEKRLALHAGMAAVCVLPEKPSMYRQQGMDLIYGINETQTAVPASVTKVLNIITALPYITSIKNKYTIDSADLKTGSGNVFQAGDIVTIEDLMYAMMLSSSNTGATALAHYVGQIILGNSATAQDCISAFLAEMNNICTRLGCANSNFTSVNGLLDGASEHSHTTCSDLLKIGIEAASWDALNRIWSTDAYTINVTGDNERAVNISTTVASNTLEDAYMILGGKTGTLTGTSPEAHTLIAICEPK